MSTFTTPAGDMFAADDEQLHEHVVTLAAHIVAGDKDAALALLAKAYGDTQAIDYATLVAQEALMRAVVHLATAATPAETITASKTLNAVTYGIRALAAAVR